MVLLVVYDGEADVCGKHGQDRNPQHTAKRVLPDANWHDQDAERVQSNQERSQQLRGDCDWPLGRTGEC